MLVLIYECSVNKGGNPGGKNMKFIKLAIASVVLVSTLFVLSANASAAQNPHDTDNCYITGLAHYTKHGDSFTITGNKASSTFEIKGDANCTKVVTIASWQAPNGTDGLPYEAQKLYKYNTKTLSVGRHTMTVELPDCFWQVDIVRGANPTAADGGPVYENHRLLDFKHGGTKVCADKPAEPVTPVKPVVKPTEKVATPASLPKTGPAASLATLLGVGSIAGVFHNIRARRSQK
jgi:hypothetical protein